MRILAVSDHVSGCMKYPGGAGLPGVLHPENVLLRKALSIAGIRTSRMKSPG
jgi:hypothetical protein